MSVRPARGTPWWIALSWLPALLLRPRGPRLLAVLVAAAVSAFFRDPERHPRGDGVLAAADGRIREVAQREDGRWFVSQYLGLYNVHVSRMPLSGVVTRRDHIPGAKKLAFSDDAVANERMEWAVATEWGELGLTQFSGAAARRIIPYVGVGAQVERGMRIGLIRFGSRVDLLLPHGFVPVVTVGDRPRGGRDVVAVQG
ncbi:phosphatidylserine decarboxylase [Nocardioides sp. SYSU D00038]|uniref:phosphatidylserine decarboxylase n=1 Tax=Nocardioides sp. SYSU D00038 TaxID=2812554 RepID=UPI0019671721|nr:phosphatidylserine decarboxylase [Nocardioides sp. SYSU D00038]